MTSEAPASASPSGAPGPSSEGGPPAQPGIVREYKAYGLRVIETNESFRGPEDEVDFWESEDFTNFGENLQKYFLPAVTIAAILIGVYASNTYDEGATTFQTIATGPETLPNLVPASQVLGP